MRVISLPPYVARQVRVMLTLGVCQPDRRMLTLREQCPRARKEPTNFDKNRTSLAPLRPVVLADEVERVDKVVLLLVSSHLSGEGR